MTSRRGRISRTSPDEPVPASTVVALQVRDIRQRRGLTAQQLADRCLALGFTGLTTHVLANIETGRRDVSVDELLAFALALDVPPASLLTPAPDRPQTLAITEQVSVTDRAALSDWICGQQPLPETDARLYTSHVTEQMPPRAGEATDAQTNAAIQVTAGRLLRQFDAEINAVVHRLRGQFTEALEEVLAQAEGGGSNAEVLQAVEDVRRRLDAAADPE